MTSPVVRTLTPTPPVRRIDTSTGSVDVVPVPCGSTREE